MSERVLVLAAHPDDEVLGCGATIAKHVKAGDAVSIVVFADGVSARVGTVGGPLGISVDAFKERHGMFRRACKILGTEDTWIHQYADNKMDTLPQLVVVQHIEKHLNRFKPTIVYTHWDGDMNVDHRVVSQCTLVACRPQPGCTVKRILMFEVPCSTSWAGGFNPDWFEDVSETMDLKLEALQCYTSEVREWPHPRSVGGVRAMAMQRGASIGADRAEGFMVRRVIA